MFLDCVRPVSRRVLNFKVTCSCSIVIYCTSSLSGKGRLETGSPPLIKSVSQARESLHRVSAVIGDPSSKRTLKIAVARFLGLPIVCPKWVDACESCKDGRFPSMTGAYLLKAACKGWTELTGLTVTILSSVNSSDMPTLLQYAGILPNKVILWGGQADFGTVYQDLGQRHGLAAVALSQFFVKSYQLLQYSNSRVFLFC